MQQGLRSKTIHGMMWSGFDHFSNMIVSFVVGVILARILSPDDYGLIAMIMIFLGISRAIIDSGFGNALIRKSDLSQDDCSTAFIFNFLVALLLYILLFFAAPWIATFYNKSILVPIVRVQSICILLNALVIVQIALVNKRIDFKKTTKVNLVSNIFSGIIAVFMAYQGYGVWALVGMNISASVVSVCLYWYLSSWIPKIVFSRASFKYLFGFGSKLLISGMIDVFFTHLQPILIGKFFSASNLGYYTKAYNYAKLPSTSLTGVVQRVTFPVLSSIQEDDERLGINYRRLLRMAAFIIFPIMVGLAAVAKPFIYVLITEKWAPCIIYMQILCFSLMWFPIHAINLNLLQVKGRTDLFLKLDIYKRIISIIIIISSIRFGIIGLCVGSVISSLISLLFNTYYTGKLINVGYILQIKDLLPIFVNSCVMGGIIFLVTSLIDFDLLKLLMGVIFGGLYYFASSYFFKFGELEELCTLVKKHNI